MKFFTYPLISLFLILPGAVHSAERGKAAVTFSIEVPNPGWEVCIIGLYKKGDELMVVSQATHDGNPSISVISTVTSTAMADGQVTKLLKKFYLVGRQWNWGDGYTAISKKEHKALIKDAEVVDFTIELKKPEKEDFIGLPLEKAQALADKHSITHRVVMVDGNPRPVTRDFRPERLNFTVVKGKVTEVGKG